MLSLLKSELNSLADPKKALVFARYFKTGRGEYGEGDVFIGVMSAGLGQVIKKYPNLPLEDLQKLLKSKIHEERSVATGILVNQYQKGDQKIKDKIYSFYLKNSHCFNNWDLVDSSAPEIVGQHLFNGDTTILEKLAKSSCLWERRIAIISTYYFIRRNISDETFKIAKALLKDPHDLIHKAVGWMLREVGKRNQEALEEFLAEHHKTMPRTMLRYAIERFSPEKRQFYLSRSICNF